MPFIESTHPNTSTNVNGVEFARHENGHMVSVQPVEGEMLDIFLSIPGFKILRAGAPTGEVALAPTVSSALAVDVSPFTKAFGGAIPRITGTVGDDGVLSMNIPFPDGSVLSLQASGPFDPNPVLTGDTGLAERAVAQLAATKAVAAADATGSEQGANDSSGAGDTSTSGAGAGADTAGGEPQGQAGDTGDAASADAASKKAGRKPGGAK